MPYMKRKLPSSLASFVSFTFLVAACAAPPDETSSAGSEVGAGSHLPLASSLPAQCATAEIARIERPVASDGTAGGKWRYGYRYRPAEPGMPVLVYLPGGPGQASTDSPPPWLPSGWGYLLTDPRGVGCNTLEDVPDAATSSAFFRSSEIAADVVAAIDHEALTRYIVAGISYGTLLGMRVVSAIEDRRLPPPLAVVLEGVVGKAFALSGEQMVGAEMIRQWERARAVLPADVLAELDTSEAPYGIAAEGWSRFLTAFMPTSTATVAGLVAGLSRALPGVTEEQRAARLALIRQLGEAHPLTQPGEVEMYRQIACREIDEMVPASDLDVVFVGGHLVRNVAEDHTKCGALTLTDPWDSSRFPFTSKAYFFLGTDDVATPLWQGNHAFEHHRGPSLRVVTGGGGHNSLSFNQRPCATGVWSSIAAGGADLPAVLATCPLPVELTTGPLR
jgi:pimeloyl-ACP methyl ester carboxylesterase